MTETSVVAIQFPSNGNINCIISPLDLAKVLEIHLGSNDFDFEFSATACTIGVPSVHQFLPLPSRRFLIIMSDNRYYVECDLTRAEQTRFYEWWLYGQNDLHEFLDGSNARPFTNLEQCAQLIRTCLFQ
jgi:hypothetical protein